MIPDTVRRELRRIPYASTCFGKSIRIQRRVRYRKNYDNRIAYLNKLKKGTPIVVYTMRRVGSRSIQKSLQSCGIKPVFHLHELEPSRIGKVRARRKGLGIHVRGPDRDLCHGEWLYYEIIKRGKKAKFISLVREPISCAISNYLCFFRDKGYSDAEYGAYFSIEELVRKFWDEAVHVEPLEWFDVEMKQTLGIDVYNYPFPKEKGYISIEKGNCKVLVIKLEVADEVKAKAIQDFLGIEEFRMVEPVNTAEDRGYIHTYRDFQQTVELPEAYVELMYSSDYMRHFYSDTEIEATKLKWRDSISKTELPPVVYEELLRAGSRGKKRRRH